MIAVKKAGAENIPLIQLQARSTWAVAYADLLSPEQMEYMLELFYSDTALQKQIQDGQQFIIAYEELIPLGFASYSSKSLQEPAVFRLHKLYIDPGQQGRGIGRMLLDFIIEDIIPRAATDLELNVKRDNKAVGFYQKHGFVILREEDIDIGNGYFMRDYIMNLSIQV